MKPNHILAFVLSLLLTQSLARAENWPAFRGPRGDGSSTETNLPTQWSATENVLWKTPIPGLGHSSPVVWADRIFLTTADSTTNDRLLLCLDRKTGAILWKKTVITAPLGPKHKENSYASSTPATDGQSVYVTFLDNADVVVAAYDFVGQQKWLVRPGQFDSIWGFSHSPVLLGDKLFISVVGMHNGVIAALNTADGKPLWSNIPKTPSQAFSAPLVTEMAGRLQMIVLANKGVTSYDPLTGQSLWSVDGPSQEHVATPVYNPKSGLLLCASSWPARILVAIKPDGQGNVTSSKIAWTVKEGTPYVPSPIAVDNYFLTSGTNKAINCYDAPSGNLLWKQENTGLHHASPVTANGLVYFLNDDGVAHVLKAGPKPELIAKNELGEKTYASPALSQGQIFLRSFNHLYCIGAK